MSTTKFKKAAAKTNVPPPKPTLSREFLSANRPKLDPELANKVELTSAESEVAWSAVKGTVNQTFVWRIERFKVVPWTHGSAFHVGDSYIIYRDCSTDTKKEYNLHFWLGAESTIDEQGAAAYKCVELDTYLSKLGIDAVQHREECYKESELLKGYFPSGIEYLPGGIETGFHVVDTKRLSNWVTKTYTMPGATIEDKGNAINVKISPTATRVQKCKIQIYVSTISLHRIDFIVNYI